MTAAPETRSAVVEKKIPHPPEKVWRALTETALLTEWMMKNDFKPVVGHKFNFNSQPFGNWDGVIACQVLAVEPHRRLSYTWSALGLDSVVTLTLEPTPDGTLVRMEQTGFRADQEYARKGALQAWPNFLDKLAGVAGRVSR